MDVDKSGEMDAQGNGKNMCEMSYTLFTLSWRIFRASYDHVDVVKWMLKVTEP
jgi:hypothetical protein